MSTKEEGTTILHLSIEPARIVLRIDDETLEERELPLEGIDPAVIHETWDSMIATARVSETVLTKTGTRCKLKADKRTWPKALR